MVSIRDLIWLKNHTKQFDQLLNGSVVYIHIENVDLDWI